jgi:uncharacterized repeat protein (TIGR01451 family)
VTVTPAVAGPANDDFADAAGLASDTEGAATGTNVNATAESGEPGGPSHSVWWKWTAPSDGPTTFTATSETINPALAVYESSSTEPGLADLLLNTSDAASEGVATVNFEAVSGKTYYLQVDGVDGQTGDLELGWTESASTGSQAAAAGDVAAAIAANPSLVTGASYTTLPPSGAPTAVATTSSASFPTNGGSYGILSSGDATQAPQPGGNTSTDLGGASVRGNTDFDVTVLKIDLAVPANANCLSFDFRFLSAEYPTFVGQTYNDAFIAELDNSSWTTSGSAITAPNNFAFDPNGKVISINATGPAAMSQADAAGTAFFHIGGAENQGGGTVLLHASTPITAGAHSLYLSIFDQGDHILDSAVFVDDLTLRTAANGACTAGAAALTVSKTADAGTADAGTQDGYTITVHNPGGSAASLDSISDVLPAGFSYVQGSTTGASTADPTVNGQTLRWTGELVVPAGGNLTLHFGVQVSATPGDYFDNASVEVTGGGTAATGDTARVTVTQPPPPSLKISGIVRNSDQEGAPLSGATVKACLVGTQECHTAPVSGEDGAYSVTGLHSGTWTVRATPPTTDLLSAAKQVTLDGEDATLDFALSANAPDLRMTLVVTPSSPQVGQKVTFTYTLQNVGPADATSVAFQASFPTSATLDSTTFTQPEALRARTLAAVSEPCTETSAGQLLCNLGTIPAGATRTLGVVVIPSTSGPLTSNATLGSDQTVADPISNQLTIGTPTSTPPATSTGGGPSGSPAPPLNPPPLPPPPSGPPLPDPIAGVNANVIPVAGVVLVNGVPLTAGEQIPLGAVIDATNGIVIITAIGADGTPQTSYFFGGAFIIVQAGPGAVPELVLQGGDFASVCGTTQRLLSAKVPKAKPKAKPKLKRVTKKVVRSLWGEGSGKFRTRGRYSAATVRGTFWLTADRCDGTLTRVEEGVVAVLDIPKKKTILVTAGHSYLAAKPGTTTK